MDNTNFHNDRVCDVQMRWILVSSGALVCAGLGISEECNVYFGVTSAVKKVLRIIPYLPINRSQAYASRVGDANAWALSHLSLNGRPLCVIP